MSGLFVFCMTFWHSKKLVSWLFNLSLREVLRRILSTREMFLLSRIHHSGYENVDLKKNKLKNKPAFKKKFKEWQENNNHP